MRILFTILSIALINFSFCDENEGLITYHPYYNTSLNDYSQGHVIERSQFMPGFNAPARYELPFFISGTYLFFQPIEKGLAFAYTNNVLASNKNRIFDMHCNFKSGFRINIGGGPTYNDWTFNIQYMRLHSSKTKNIHQTLISTWASTQNAMSQTKAKWHLSMDILDLLFSRPFYCGTHVILDPSFGIKGGWIKQKFSTDSIINEEDTLLYSKDSINSWLTGLGANLKARYILGLGLGFFAKLSTSLFYQNFKVKNQQNGSTTPYLFSDNSVNKISYINPNLNISSGLEWGQYFMNKTFHFALLVGYEAQIYWNQNLMEELKELRHNYYLQDAGSLYLHGIIAELRFDF